MAAVAATSTLLAKEFDPLDTKVGKILPFSNAYYALCGTGGIVACSTTRMALTPLDNVKAHMQLNPVKYKGIMNSFNILRSEGISIWRGWSANAAGFGCQGFFRFGLFEAGKREGAVYFGEDMLRKHRFSFFMVSAGLAEGIADLVLVPFEMVKLNMQTNAAYMHDGLLASMARYQRTNGFGAFWHGLPMLWARQIPYTVSKFTAFEGIIEVVYGNILTKPKSSYSDTEQLAISFGCGYLAGLFCAVASHPQDTIVTKLSDGKNSSIGTIIKELGFMGMWRGLKPRLLMIGAIGAWQWLVYDSIKAFYGIDNNSIIGHVKKMPPTEPSFLAPRDKRAASAAAAAAAAPVPSPK